jgi:hypothetical protein
MTSLLRNVFFTITILSVHSCIDKPCEDSGGVCNDTYESLFRVVSISTGKDLVYGPDKIYNSSAVSMFFKTGTGISYATCEPYGLIKDGYDSVLLFHLASIVDTLYMKLENTDVDTLLLSYGAREGKCCSYNSIKEISFNGSNFLPNYNGTVEFRK